MTKLTLAFMLLLTAAAGAHAQRATGTTPVGTPYPAGSTNEYPRKITDPVILSENHIADSRNAGASSEREANAAGRIAVPTFKAELKVTNHAAQAIKSVSWTATLLDSATGTVIHTYDVTTEAKIAPGKTKKLSEHLRKPSASRVSADTRGAKVADLRVKVNAVTYADGSTSTTP
ncbi:MAG: hypothetical protein ACJ754_12740 [Pyrinomonadaceae bacterium]